MTQRVYLHIGAPKTGTTYLQAVLDRNRDVLAADGVLVVGRRWIDRVHAGMVVREDPRLDRLPERARTAWDRLVAEIRGWDGRSAVLSYELFAGATAEQAAWALGSLDGLEVHLVFTARSFAKQLPSAWQERLKYHLTTTFTDWTPPDEDAGPRAEWGWRTMDPVNVLGRWGASLPADRVHLVTVPRRDAGRDELWRRFARACDLTTPGLELDVSRPNESLGLVAAELLRRTNEHITEPVRGSRETARWIRNVLANRVLAGHDKEPIGLSPEQAREVARRSDTAIAVLAEAGYDVVGDLEELRADESGSPGRLPSEVDDAELVGAATRALADLLQLVRERTLERDDLKRRLTAALAAPDPASSPEATAGGGSRVRAAGRWLVANSTDRLLLRENRALQDRVTRLEEALQERRHLHHRLAEVTDVVTELLLPARQRDDATIAAAVDRYRRENGT